MKTTFLLCGVVISTLIASSPAHAQYNARNLTRRINPQRGAPGAPAQPKPPAQPALPPTPPTAPAAPAPAPAQPVRRAAPVAAAVPVDPEKERAAKEETERKAVEFEMKRANEDFGWAQYNLGMRYLAGNGVGQDAIEGRKWLEKAAKNGENRATKELVKLEKEKNESGDPGASTDVKKSREPAAADDALKTPSSKDGESGKK